MNEAKVSELTGELKKFLLKINLNKLVREDFDAEIENRIKRAVDGSEGLIPTEEEADNLFSALRSYSKEIARLLED